MFRMPGQKALLTGPEITLDNYIQFYDTISFTYANGLLTGAV
jgi:hypothetical protein